MENENLELNPDSFKDMSKKYEKFEMNEVELLQFMALQMENVLAPTLQKYKLYYYVQASNEVAEAIFEHTSMFCDMKRKIK